MPDKDVTGPGRPADPDSLRSRLNRGEARNLKVIIPEEQYRALRIEAAVTEKTLSELVSDAIARWLASR